MKKIICLTMSLLLMLSATLLVASCGNKEDENSLPDYIEGVYLPEEGMGSVVYVFTKELLVMQQLINTEVVEFHFSYEIAVNERTDATEIILTYEGVSYAGGDADVAWYVTGMRNEYSKNPTQVSEIEFGDGYLIVGERKLIKQ